MAKAPAMFDPDMQPSKASSGERIHIPAVMCVCSVLRAGTGRAPKATEACEMRWLHRAAMDPSEGSTALSTRAEMLRATRPSSAAAAVECGALLGLPGLLGCQEDLCRSCMDARSRMTFPERAMVTTTGFSARGDSWVRLPGGSLQVLQMACNPLGRQTARMLLGEAPSFL